MSDSYESRLYANDSATLNISKIETDTVTEDSGYSTFLGNASVRQAICEPDTENSLFVSVMFAMYLCVFVVALAGNGLVCWVVHVTPRMKTVTNYFIVNLAVGDILLTVLCVPFSFVSTLVLHHWVFGEALCRLVNFSQAVSVLVSSYTLLAISADRYVAIARPLQPRLGRKAARTVLAAVWVGALATASPIAIVSALHKPTDWHQYCDFAVCSELWSTPEQSSQYTCALLVLQFALPLSALASTYARIACIVDKRPPGEAYSARDHRLQQAKSKMIKMMVAVVVVYTACWLPLNVFIVLWSIHENEFEWASWPGMPYVWSVSHWLAMSHSCYNPIIYCYMNTRYRRGYKQALSCCWCRRTEFPPRQYPRSSLCEGMPMSEMVGMNGITRRGTASSHDCNLHRVPTSSTNASERRARSGYTTPPVRALSVRYT